MKVLREFALAALLIGMPVAAVAQAQAGAQVAAATAGERSSLVLESGTGRVLTLRAPAANVFVADPKVAEVRPASAASLFVFGVSAGRTTVAALDNDGHAIAQYDVTVQPSAFGATQTQSMIARLVPGSHVQVQAQTKGMVLSGVVGSASEAAQAVAIAKGFAGDQIVENQISVASPIQVTLRVRIAQMQRSVLRALGINWASLGTIGKFSANFVTANTLATAGATASRLGLHFIDGTTNTANALIDALAQDNLARVLAEPNLTVMSGQPASFLVGGQFPVPVNQQNNAISIEYKSFGVTLSFVPTVFSDGRINLHVAPEVSELSNQNSVQINSGSATLVVPSLTVRRAETTVELGSGQTFAIAGLLQDTITQNTSGLPFLSDIPVLGPLFRADSFNRQETELVILVTPYVVRPVNDASELHLPTDDTKPPGEIDRLLFMRQVGHGQQAVPVRIPGSAGFIVQ
jgi:pilus assembly protein CpaC